MGLEKKYSLIWICMKANTRMENLMVKELTNGRMATCTEETLLTVFVMEMAYGTRKMVKKRTNMSFLAIFILG
jgi:hypothetical protein